MSNPLLSCTKLLALVPSCEVGSNTVKFFFFFWTLCIFWLAISLYTLSFLYYERENNCPFSSSLYPCIVLFTSTAFSEIRDPHLYVFSSLAIGACPWKHPMPCSSRIKGGDYKWTIMWQTYLMNTYIQGGHKCENITTSLWTIRKQKNDWINWVHYSLWITCPVLSLIT